MKINDLPNKTSAIDLLAKQQNRRLSGVMGNGVNEIKHSLTYRVSIRNESIKVEFNVLILFMNKYTLCVIGFIMKHQILMITV